MPERSHRVLARIPLTIRRGAGVFERAILRHGRHDPVHIVAFNASLKRRTVPGSQRVVGSRDIFAVIPSRLLSVFDVC